MNGPQRRDKNNWSNRVMSTLILIGFIVLVAVVVYFVSQVHFQSSN